MKRTWIQITAPLLCTAYILSACTGMQQNPHVNSTEVKSTPGTIHDTKAHSDNTLIPSYDGTKVKTTNQYGTSFSGMGTSVYSRIGSSGLLASGVSSQLETMLNNAGIPGIKALVLGDLVVLGETTPHTDGASYEPLQSKLLSPNKGSSGKGLPSARGADPSMEIKGTKETNLIRAQSEVQSIFGGNIRIFTVNNNDGLSAMDRVKSTLNSGSDANKLGHDISTILKHASEQNVK